MSARLWAGVVVGVMLGACASDGVRVEAMLPLALQQAFDNFNHLTATFDIAKANGESLSGFPQTLDIEGKSSVSLTVELDPSPESLEVLLSYEDQSRINPGTELVILDQSIDKLDVMPESHPPIDMSYDAAQNMAGGDYDANDNGVSNFAERVMGWEPDRPGLAWIAEIPSAREEWYNFQIEALGAHQVVVGRWPAGTGGTSALSVVDGAGTHAERWHVELGDASAAWTVDLPADGSRSRVLLAGCFANCSVSGPVYEMVSKVYNAGLDAWSDEFTPANLPLPATPTGAPAVAPDGTVWQPSYGANLIKVVGGSATNVVMTGTGLPSCYAPPKVNNTWLADGHLYLPFAAGGGCATQEADMNLARIHLPVASETIATLDKIVDLGPVSNNLLFTASNAVPPVVTLYAATNLALKAFDVSREDPQTLWTTTAAQVSSSCGSTGSGMNTASAPVMGPTGPLWAMFGACTLFAFDANAGAEPVWKADLLAQNQVGNLARRLALTPSGGVAFAGVFPDDPGAPLEKHSALTNQRIVGGLALAPPAAATDSAQSLTEAFFANAWQPPFDGEVARPESNILVTADALYFVAAVKDSFTYVDATNAVQTVSCPAAPCHYLFAAAR